MKGRFDVEVSVDDDTHLTFVKLPYEVVLAVGEDTVQLSPKQARKVAKRLKQHAAKVELANKVRVARREGTRAEVDHATRGYL